MRPCLITGGAGFIGSHLAEALLARGTTVRVLDDLSSGRRANVEHLLAHPAFEFSHGSINDRALLDRSVAGCDLVYHLAATVGVLNIIKSPVETIENNINGTQFVLDAAHRAGARVVLASTSEVYGKGAKVPFNEDDDLLLGPTSRSRWSYAASKIVDEFLALAFLREKGLPSTIVRLFNTIGPRQRGQYGMVAPRFVRRALANQPIPIYGDGSQRRVFTYVADIVEWLIRLGQSTAAVGEVVNLGGAEEVSIAGLARRVIEITGSTSPLQFVPYATAYEEGFEDIARRAPDISKAVRLTAYSPQTGLDESIRRISQWCAAHPE